MYRITVDDKIFYTSTAPNYVKKKLESDAWIKSSKEDAEGIAVFGEIYSLPNKPPIENKNVANVKEIDGGTIIFEVSNKTKDNASKSRGTLRFERRIGGVERWLRYGQKEFWQERENLKKYQLRLKRM